MKALLFTFPRCSVSEFGKGTFHAGLPQLPLTLLNSVVALTALAKTLYPSDREVSQSDQDQPACR